jgi:hypothetical protein
MSTLVGSQGLQQVWTPPLSKPLDEAVWRAWVEKGRARDGRNRTAGVKAAKWISLAGLLAVAGLWSRPAPYEVLIRFVVAGGSIALMLQSMDTRRYFFAALFGALALLYNPVVPLFTFSGGWQRLVVLASAAPFLASIALPVIKDRKDD